MPPLQWTTFTPPFTFIYDGEKLKPLNGIEQKQLIQALKDIGNTEMNLSFLLALTTGARMQTVFTLRRSNFENKVSDDQGFEVIKVGGTSGVDSKFNSEVAIAVPKWLCDKVRTYLNSERYSRRAQLLTRRNDAGDSYVFITTRGNPYYQSKSDRFIYTSKPRRGGSVRKFIAAQLLPKICKEHSHFKVRFHDLRATYGVNLVKYLTNRLENKLLTESSSEFMYVVEFVRSRLGHQDIKTTLQYLRFPTDTQLLLNFQSEFEQFIFGKYDER